MMTGLTLVLAGAVFWWLTEPPELRPQRWWKLPVGLMLTGAILPLFGEALQFGAGWRLILMAVLACLWTENVAHVVSRFCVEKLLYACGSEGRGVTCYAAARVALETCDYSRAEELLDKEMGKDAQDPEGMLLRAELLERTDRVTEAINVLAQVERHRRATRWQAHQAAASRKRLDRTPRPTIVTARGFRGGQ